MATAVEVPLPEVKVSLETYLNSSYRPDVEYLEGELKEKTSVTSAHGEVQMLLGVWFHQCRKEWSIRCAVEVRTQVQPERVRLPDFVVMVRAEREKRALARPPLIAIEVLSPSDIYKDLKARAADLAAMGVQNIWLIDPELRTIEIWQNGSWQLGRINRVQAVNAPVYLDLDWLWQQMDED